MEMMLVISMAGLFMVGVYETVITGLRLANAADEREQIRQGLADVLERFSRDASMCVNLDEGEDAQFQCDVDANGVGGSTGTERDHNYTVSGSTLTWNYSGSPAGAQTILRNITSWDFNYLRAGSATEYTTCDLTSASGSATCVDAANCCQADARTVIVTATLTRDTETISATTAVPLMNCRSGC